MMTLEELRTEVDASTGEFLQDLEVTPGGAHVLVVTYVVDYPLVFATADMSEVGYYNSSVRTSLVEIRPDGPDGQVLTGTPSGIIDAFAIGENRKVWVSYEGVAEPGLEMVGLAWAPDGGRVYTVSNLWNGQPRLRVLVPPPVQTAITADLSTWPVLVRRPLTIAGRLGSEDNTRPGAQRLRVIRQDRRGLVHLPDLTTATDGTFSLIDRPRTTGETVYTFQFEGTDILLPTQQTVSLVVAKR
jgi:hypothetical protein